MRWRWRARQEDSDLGLSEFELDRLGTYNAERARGIVHTPAWQAQMASLQAQFDEHQWQERAGWTEMFPPIELSPGVRSGSSGRSAVVLTSVKLSW